MVACVKQNMVILVMAQVQVYFSLMPIDSTGSVKQISIAFN